MESAVPLKSRTGGYPAIVNMLYSGNTATESALFMCNLASNWLKQIVKKEVMIL
jgi:hypothetical protein